MENLCFSSAEILLPDFHKIDAKKWAVIACDQHTSEPEYWNAVEKEVGSAPSTLRLTLPELYLNESDLKIPAIHMEMEKALKNYLIPYPDALIYVERTQSDGNIRKGIVGKIDLEAYDYHKNSVAPIRATEGTVLERIPPRVKVRRDAALELPHVMLLIDDPERNVIEPMANLLENEKPVYSFDLMLEGGKIQGKLLTEEAKKAVLSGLSKLSTPEKMKEKYGRDDLPALLFAVGDGNHSLATAKAAYEEIKEKIGADAAKKHPARYALAEIVNLHDEALQFEPIYRVAFGVNPQELLQSFRSFSKALSGGAGPQAVTFLAQGICEEVMIDRPKFQLTVATLQAFLEEYQKLHPEMSVDYIHGEKTLHHLSQKPNTVGFLFQGIQKEQLFKTVLFDGSLPRKTFSMGQASDKRYYLECRKIR